MVRAFRSNDPNIISRGDEDTLQGPESSLFNRYLLKLSRILGLYPISITKSKSSGLWEMKFSLFWAIYSFVSTIIAIGAMNYTLLFDLTTVTGNSSVTSNILLITYSEVTVITALVGVTRAVLHVKRILLQFTILRKVDTNLSRISKTSSKGHAFSIFAVLLLLFWSCILIGDIINSLFFTPGETTEQDELASFFIYYGSFSWLYVMTIAMTLLYSRTIYELGYRFQRLNRTFNRLNKELDTPKWIYGYAQPGILMLENKSEFEEKRSSSNVIYSIDTSGLINMLTTPLKINSKHMEKLSTSKALPDELRTNIHTAIETRLLLSDLASIIEKTFGPALFILIVSLSINMIPCCYDIITTSGNSSTRNLMIFEILRLVGQIIALLMVVESCHRVSIIAFESTQYVTPILAHVKDIKLRSYIKYCLRHLEENPVSFTGMEIFRINRTLISNILLTVMSNLVILIQLDSAWSKQSKSTPVAENNTILD